MNNIFILVLFNLSMVFGQFLWQEGGIAIRQGDHVEWQRTGDSSLNGSMIIAWSDTRNAIRDIYAQKITSNGDYLWGADGALIVDFDGRQEDPLLVSDGVGGAYIIWRDYRDENYYGDIYAQHIDSDGNRLWDANGVPLSTMSGEQSSHNLCIDGNGGAFAVWLDKNGSGTYIGSHLGPDGPGEAVEISSTQNGGFSLEYAGNGEAVMVWKDALVADLRAQRFNVSMDMLWNEGGDNSGRIICDAPGIQSNAKVTTFGDNVIVTWKDLRNDPDGDVYAQIFTPSGESLLENNGLAVCDDPAQQASPRVKTDGVNAFIYWEDKRNEVNNNSNVDPYVQKMDSSGNLLWTSNGVQVSNNQAEQISVRMSPDQSGGAYFTWVDNRFSPDDSNKGSDIYAQHIDIDGSTTFGLDGIEIDVDQGVQGLPLIKTNSLGDAYIIWSDQKSGSDIIIEVQKLTTQGIEFTQNGKEIFYGQDGDSYLSSTLQVSDGQVLVAFEDQRYHSNLFPGCYTYGLFLDEFSNSTSHDNSAPLSLNEYQGPHDQNSWRRGNLVKSDDRIMMNFTEYSDGFSQYVQALDFNGNLIGGSNGTDVDPSGGVQPYSDICEMNNNFYVAFTNVVGGYGIDLQKFNGSGVALWSSPVNIADGSAPIGDPNFGDNYVREIIADEANNNVVIIYETSSFLGAKLSVAFVDGNSGEIQSVSSWCSDCSFPQYEAHAMGDNELIVTFRKSGSLASGVYAQVFALNGQMMESDEGLVISDEANDQRNSDIVYNSVYDEYLVCWDDSRDISSAGWACGDSSAGANYSSEAECIADCGGLDCQEVLVADSDLICSTLNYEEDELTVSDAIPIASIPVTSQEDATVFAAASGTYMIAWKDMRNAANIDQSLNLSFEWDAYYQELTPQGIVYEDGGIALSTEPFQQVNFKFSALSEEDNLYVVVWEDDRSTGKALLTNIYGQLISPSADSCMVMDPNDDGGIDVLDVVLMVNIVLGNTTPTDLESCASDVNGDGATDILDIVAIVNYILNA